MSHVPKSSTRGAIRKYVEDAAAVVREKGPSCDTFASDRWRDRDYYIFVVGPDGTLLCHADASLVGKPAASIANSEGAKVGEMIVEKANGTGKGWLDYRWPQPRTNVQRIKSTYVVGVIREDGAHYVVGAGGFHVQ